MQGSRAKEARGFHSQLPLRNYLDEFGGTIENKRFLNDRRCGYPSCRKKNSPHMLKFGTLPDSTFGIFFKAGRDLVQRLRTFVGPRVTILFRDKWQMRRFHASAVFGADCRAILNDSSWCQPIKPFGPTGERSKHGQSQGS